MTGLYKTLPVVTRISGAKPGAITPASQLEINSMTTVKPRRRKEAFEGFVDWSDPSRVELRLVRINGDRAWQLPTNGLHRVSGAVK